MRGFESRLPSQHPDAKGVYDPLAQMAEHLTFNQGVRGSTPRWVTKTKRADLSALFVLLMWGVEPRAPRVACKPREKGAVHLLIAIDGTN